LHHVHFGAGKLGLGLVGWISNHLNLQLYIANRSNPATGILSARNRLIAEQFGYDIAYGPTVVEAIRVVAVLNLDNVGDRQELVSLIASPETQLLTTSMVEAHPSVMSIIREGLLQRARAAAQPLYILACENELKSEDLLAHIESGLTEKDANAIRNAGTFIPCVVDRVCVGVSALRGRTIVAAAQFGRLSLPPNADRAFFEGRLSQAARDANAIAIEHDIEFAEIKKKWLFNGPHLIIAINAYYDGHLTFHEYVQNNSDLAQEIFHEFAMGCFHVCSQNTRLLAMGVDKIYRQIQNEVSINQQRFRDFPDSTQRIISRFLEPTKDKPNTLQLFFKNLRYKVVEPATTYCESEGQMPHRISYTLLRLIELIADGRFIRRDTE